MVRYEDNRILFTTTTQTRRSTTLVQCLLIGNCILTRMYVGNQLQHHGPIARQHLQLVFQYHILEVRQSVLHLSHVVGQILYRFGTAEQVVPMARFATAPVSAPAPGTVGRM